MKKRRQNLIYFIIVLILAFTGCGNDGGSDKNESPKYSVMGGVADLTADGLVLTLNGNEEITLNSGDTSFMFSTMLNDGADYAVAVKVNANNLTCGVTHSTGTIAGEDVYNVMVNCYSNDYTSLFTDASAGLTGVYYSSSSFGDVDGDGDLDFVITGFISSSGLTTILYLNNGSGDFTDASAGLDGIGYSSISFGDVDGDGDRDLDLVITGRSDGSNYTAILYTNGLK